MKYKPKPNKLTDSGTNPNKPTFNLNLLVETNSMSRDKIQIQIQTKTKKPILNY